MTALAEYAGARDLFVNLTLRDLRSKYKRSFLGWTWSMINPLTYMIIYTVVFHYVFRAKIAAGAPSGLSVYALFLLCGLLPWNFFVTAVSSAVGSLTAASNLVKKSYFPRALLVSHLIEMALLVVTLVAFGDYRALYFMPFTILLIALVVVFGTGLGLAMSALNVYFRDIEHFIGIAFMVWFYLTPIVYSITYLHGHNIFLIKLNPMADAVLCFRSVLYDASLPSWIQLGTFAFSAFFVFGVGMVIFRHFEDNLAEEL